MNGLKHVRAGWPEPDVPEGEPLWLLHELNERADAATRSIEVFADATLTRNSIAIEERNGKACPSLSDTALAAGFAGVEFEEISVEEFERTWAKGEDASFWNVREPPFLAEIQPVRFKLSPWCSRALRRRF